MLLHATNKPFPVGGILTTAKSRQAKGNWANDSEDYVYCVDTEYSVPAGEEDFVHRTENYVMDEDAVATKQQKALAAAQYYGVGAASKKLHPSSLSLAVAANDLLADEYGEPYEPSYSYATADDIARLERNSKILGVPTKKLVTDEQWESLSPSEQDEYNNSFDGEPEEVKPLRGYWVYEVEVVKGDLEDDDSTHFSTRKVKDGQLRIKRAVIADGVLVADDMVMPPTRAVVPESCNGYEKKVLDSLTAKFEARKQGLVEAPQDLTEMLRQKLNMVLAPSAKDKDSVTNCVAKTSKRLACKRVVRGNGVCWQHAKSR